MLVAGIAQVIGQHRVHHHALQRQAVTQQDQPVVFGVLQGLGVGGAGQPGGQGGEHRSEGQLQRRRRRFREQIRCRLALVADRDVGQLRQAIAPGHPHPHQLGLEGIEAGCFCV